MGEHKKISEQGRTFRMNAVEERRYVEWLEVHRKHCSATLKRAEPRIPGDPEPDDSVIYPYPNMKFVFSPTGVGDGVEVICECGRSLDVTDMESW